MRPVYHLRKVLINPIKDLAEHGKLSGILMIGATILSLILSNSDFSANYISFWQKGLNLPGFQHPVIFWINDGLMPFFFFLVGIEIKRELVDGELSSFRQAILPFFAALGGMLIPALIFLSFNAGNAANLRGWAIPTATDIAFSLGVLSLLGKRVPFSMKVFLTALAIIDDLGAIIIIAFFYSGSIQWIMLLTGLLIVLILFMLNIFRIKTLFPYIILGILLWYFVLHSGIHPTIAGVIIALTIPVKVAERFETRLHTPVYYFILPVFALANTAIPLSFDIRGTLSSTLSLGIMAGLFIGKPAGIVLAVFILVKSKVSGMLSNVNWVQMTGLGLTAGIGFTMSIFISTLSFSDEEKISIAKLSVIAGSVLSALAGLLILRLSARRVSDRIQS